MHTTRTLETFLRDGLELDPDVIKAVGVLQLPQRPLKKASKMKTRPIIFKVSTVFDKDQRCSVTFQIKHAIILTSLVIRL